MRSPSRLPPQQASGTVRRSDLRHLAPKPASVGWPLIVLGFAIGAAAIAWVLAGGSPPQVVGTNLASGAHLPGSAIAAAPSPASRNVQGPSPVAVPSPSPTLSRTPEVVRPTPTPAGTPSPAPPTLAPTPRPAESPPSQAATLRIIFPADGEVVHDQAFNVVGNGPPGATVTRDIPFWFDDHVQVRDDGNWLMPISLGEGQNTLRFRIGDDRSTETVLTVIYEPRA